LQIAVPTVRFGPNGAKAIAWFTGVRDVNHDAFSDLVLWFRVRNTGIQCGDLEATLTGQNNDGLQISGSDAITTVGCH
ncbi:MAG: hypothetical protein WBN05_11115, partial [Woeseiaceae bacterium]